MIDYVYKMIGKWKSEGISFLIDFALFLNLCLVLLSFICFIYTLHGIDLGILWSTWKGLAVAEMILLFLGLYEIEDSVDKLQNDIEKIQKRQNEIIKYLEMG